MIRKICHGRGKRLSGDESVFLIVLMETIAAIFLIIRRDPDETRHTWQTWTTTMFGTLALSVFEQMDQR